MRLGRELVLRRGMNMVPKLGRKVIGRIKVVRELSEYQEDNEDVVSRSRGCHEYQKDNEDVVRSGSNEDDDAGSRSSKVQACFLPSNSSKKHPRPFSQHKYRFSSFFFQIQQSCVILLLLPAPAKLHHPSPSSSSFFQQDAIVSALRSAQFNCYPPAAVILPKRR
ncbi:hypothetical protein Pint_35741 [Pistacia integerrima]|uniref:Uncharacterized protein n=1 Tax=Pistacia integerrima TaxID=434235 RepID=A0ACC0Y2R9_9ROSI|nr:hypothetical protein Pint_35741 [Pistacia integerrima]